MFVLPGLFGNTQRNCFDKSAAAFTPADLFTGGYGGIWLDFSDATKGFSDAGVTQITNGGTVQQWNDSSGNGNTMSQATAGSRPSWTNTGYTTFDGTADHLAASGALDLYNSAAGVSVFALVKANGAANTAICGEGRNDNTNTVYSLFHSDPIVSSTHTALMRSDGNVTNYANTTDLQTSVLDNTKRRLGVTVNTAQDSITPYSAGSAGTPVAGAASGTYTPNTFAVGCIKRTTNSFLCNIPELYQLIIVKKVMSAGEISSLDTWLQTK